MNYNKIKTLLKRIQEELARETLETKTMLSIYSKATIGEASPEELKYASKQFKDLLKNVGFGTVLILPFAPVSIYLLIQLSKKFDIDILPPWYKKSETNLWDSFAVNYSDEVFSLTKFKRHVDNIINELEDDKKILIIGAGSEVFLQKAILEKLPKSKIIISDYSFKMLEESKKNFNHENLNFELMDMTNINYSDEFDYIISTNSILLNSIEKNNLAFKEITKSLKPDGKLIAYLVSFDSCLNLCKLDPSLENVLQLDHKNQSIYDSSEIQSYHTQLSIRKNMYLNNMKEEKLDKVFLNQEDEIKEMNKIYGISEDILKEVFEYFLVARKM